MNNCKIRLVEERDIPILFEHLKEFLETPNASTTGNPLPLFEDSKKFVLKYLYENENHEYDKWYMVINDEDEILGNVYIKKKNIISYHILEKYQKQGFGETSVKLMMKKNPRKTYFAVVNMNNKPSIEFIKKFKFKEKAFIFEKTNDS
ncbi:MAG: hypothetical protein CMO11_00160 [Thaumarchaeota archaeon]|nr:hypothetical protein [Nitrososphaerota archaeon]